MKVYLDNPLFLLRNRNKPVALWHNCLLIPRTNGHCIYCASVELQRSWQIGNVIVHLPAHTLLTLLSVLYLFWGCCICSALNLLIITEYTKSLHSYLWRLLGNKCFWVVNVHLAGPLSRCFAPLSQQRNGLGGNKSLVRGRVVLLVPWSGKTTASVIMNTKRFHLRLSEEVMKNWQSIRHFFNKLH